MAKPGQPSKRKSTRSSRAKIAQKKAPVKKPVAAVEPETAVKPVADLLASYPRLPSAYALLKQSITTMLQARWLFASITTLYVVLYVLFVKGLSAGVNVASLRDQFTDKFSGSVATYVSLLGNVSSVSSTNGTQVYQIITVIVASLALIWALRQVQAGVTTISLRDTFYKGMYPLVPFVLVIIVALVELVPLFIGVTLYQIVIIASIAVTAFEKLIWGIGVFALISFSLYLVTSTLIAIYIATLPDMTPVKAIRSANQLVRKRRGTILRKVLALPLFLLVAAALIMVPVVIVLPIVAPWLLVILSGIALTVTHAYMYTLYRELLNE